MGLVVAIICGNIHAVDRAVHADQYESPVVSSLIVVIVDNGVLGRIKDGEDPCPALLCAHCHELSELLKDLQQLNCQFGRNLIVDVDCQMILATKYLRPTLLHINETSVHYVRKW